MNVPPPKTRAKYPDRYLDCEFALEPYFQAVAALAEQAGWEADEVSYALARLA
jgi:hypothetical protein